jgi:hypothetical protein
LIEAPDPSSAAPEGLAVFSSFFQLDIHDLMVLMSLLLSSSLSAMLRLAADWVENIWQAALSLKSLYRNLGQRLPTGTECLTIQAYVSPVTEENVGEILSMFRVMRR